jgi:hypothetical protein
MAVTANRSYPYPIAADSPAGHTQIQALATAVDVDMANVDRWQSGYMTADISVTSSTALVDATGLSFPVAANHRYTFTANLFYQAVTASRMKIGWTGPAGAVFLHSGIGLDTGASTITGASNVLSYATSGLLVFGGTASNVMAVVTGSVTTVGNAGTFQLQFAQSISGAIATTLRMSSTIIGRRLT